MILGFKRPEPAHIRRLKKTCHAWRKEGNFDFVLDERFKQIYPLMHRTIVKMQKDLALIVAQHIGSDYIVNETTFHNLSVKCF